MPLFRKKPQSQAERLAAWRADAVAGSGGVDAPLSELLEEVGAGATHEQRGWVVPVAGSQLFVAWIAKERVLGGFAPLADTRDRRELAELLQRNLEPRLAWCSLGGEDDLGARFALPLASFDRAAVALALETMAGLLGDEALAARAREARSPARGEQSEETAEQRAREAVEAGLREAGLHAERADERPGVWRVTVDRGTVEAVLRDTGESIQFLCELEYTGGDEDVDVLRWLLLASDWNHARLGLATLPGGPGLFATSAVASLEAPALAWGVEQALRLADDYDEKAGGT